MFAIEVRRSKLEKKVIWASVAILVLGWVFLFQDLVLTRMYNQTGHLTPEWGPPSYVA